MEPNMFCYQCQETAKGTGCILKGVCGKESHTAQAMDLLLFVVRGISVVADTLRKADSPVSEEVNIFVTDALFCTITNANFDDESILKRVDRGLALRNGLIQEAKHNKVFLPQVDELTWQGTRDDYAEKAKTVGVLREQNEDLRSLKELLVYGLKGMAAYLEHAMRLGFNDDTALDVAIKAAEEKIREENFENKYTEASKTALRENLENAKLAKENANLSVEDVKLVVDALNASIEELQLKAVVTINNNDQIETKYCEIGEQVRVVAQTVKDKKFSHWTFNGTPICYSSPYTFTVYGDTTIEAVYVDAGEEVTPQAAMLCSVSYNKSTQTIKYTAKRSVPEGCKIVKHGMILTSKPAWEALYKDNQEAFKLEADRIITKVATTTGLAGNYSVSVKCTKPNIWYAKGYVVYTDKNGEEQTVYSDVVSYEVK